MTLENIVRRPSRSKKIEYGVPHLSIISFTHKTISLSDLSGFFLDENTRIKRLSLLREPMAINEILYLATCNRIEFILTGNQSCDKEFLRSFFHEFNPDWTGKDIDFAVQHAKVYEDDMALHHIFSVASSLDSMVVGEREIITQVRKAYDECYAAGLTGDFLRLVIQRTITTAKKVFTETKIATHPVSVVSLAYRNLKRQNVKLDASILVIGAGETNTNLLKYLVKHGFRKFSIFNRTEVNGEKLAKSLRAVSVNATAYPLKALNEFSDGFDVLISCTASSEPVISSVLYDKLLEGDKSKKVIIDLAMPADVDPAVIEKNNIHLIDVRALQTESEKNLAERHHELKSAEAIIGESIVEFHQVHRLRKVELAMKTVPEQIREIKSKAVNDVFAGEIGKLDEESRNLVGKILDYMEKKCISVPMLMAKEILLEEN